MFHKNKWKKLQLESQKNLSGIEILTKNKNGRKIVAIKEGKEIRINFSNNIGLANTELGNLLNNKYNGEATFVLQEEDDIFKLCQKNEYKLEIKK